MPPPAIPEMFCQTKLFAITGEERMQRLPLFLPLRMVKPSRRVVFVAPEGALTTCVGVPPPSRIVTLLDQFRCDKLVSVPVNPPYTATPSFKVKIPSGEVDVTKYFPAA